MSAFFRVDRHSLSEALQVPRHLATTSNRPVGSFTPALLDERTNFPSEGGEGSLNPVPVRVALLVHNSIILTFECFPPGQGWMNVKGSDVIRANECRSEQRCSRQAAWRPSPAPLDSAPRPKIHRSLQ